MGGVPHPLVRAVLIHFEPAREADPAALLQPFGAFVGLVAEGAHVEIDDAGLWAAFGPWRGTAMRMRHSAMPARLRRSHGSPVSVPIRLTEFTARIALCTYRFVYGGLSAAPG